MTIKPIIVHLITAATGDTGKEAGFGAVSAVAGTTIAAALGGWDISLRILIALMVADYVTGFLGALKNKNINSDVMFWGGVRKGVVLLVIFLSVLLDQFISADAPVFRTLAIYFYAGREGLSLIENTAVLGLPWPPAIKGALEQVKRKGDVTDGQNNAR